MLSKFFILGNPRSGTSLLRLMLNSHKQMVSPPESGFMQWWRIKYSAWSIEDSYNELQVGEFLDDLSHSKKIETWNLDYNILKQIIRKEGPSTYGDLCEKVYVAYALRKGKSAKIIIDKNNYYIKHLDEISAIWPSAKYIYLVRDGRDVACSYKELKKLDSNSPYKPILADDIKSIASEWLINNNTIQSFLERLGSECYAIVRYEDLISSPELVLEKLCHFCNVPFQQNMLSYYKDNQEMAEEPKETLDWKKKTLEKPDPNNSGKFLNILTEEEVRIFNEIAGELLQKHGYL